LGLSGAAPSHRELVDELAASLIESGWSLKQLHRRIVTSAVYRQTSRPSAAGLRLDADNRLWWRYPLRRLDAEAVRDGMLAACGELDERMGGAYVPTRQTSVGEVVVDEGNPGARRRSVYLQHRRTQMASLLSVFDAPTMTVNCTRRGTTTIPLQSLSLLNSDFVRGRAAALARRLAGERADPARALDRAWWLVVGRSATAGERAAALAFLADQTAQYRTVMQDEQRAVDAAWTDLCQMVLASNQFLYVE
jgi:hypothetical protein